MGDSDKLLPFYNPLISYEENFDKGPFGEFANEEKIDRVGESKDEFLGFPVYLPFGIPAGPLVNSKFIKAAFDKGFDINTYKTVRTKKRGCHQWPNVLPVKVKGDLTLEKASKELVTKNEYSEPLSITNSFGVPSKDPSWWQEDLSKAVDSAGKGQLVIGSFQGTPTENGGVDEYIKDHVLAARLVKQVGAKVLEVNLSCPNEGTANLLCYDVERTVRIAEAIKNEIGETPLLLKLAYFEDERLLKKLVKQVGSVVQGLVMINTIPAKIVTSKGDQALPGKGRERSGVCGKAIKWAGLEMVKRLKSLREEMGYSFAIVGVGGVMQVEDYNEYIKVGADAVQSATGAMWNPLLAQEIIK